MKELKIKLVIDITQQSQTQALEVLLQAIGGQDSSKVAPLARLESTIIKPASEDKVADATATSEAPKKKRRTKAEIAADKAAQASANAPAEEEEQEQEEEESKLTFTEVRALFAKQLQAGGEKAKDACLAKLNEFGVSRLPDLDEEYFQLFVDFLNDAKW